MGDDQRRRRRVLAWLRSDGRPATGQDRVRQLQKRYSSGIWLPVHRRPTGHEPHL